METLKSNIASIVGSDATGGKAPTGLEGLDSVTLTRFVLHGQKSHAEAKGDLTMLLAAVQLACKVTETCVRRAGIANLYGLAGSGNVQGEDQKKLDIIANDTFKVNIQSSGKCCVMVSEEEDLAILCDRTYNTGKYAIAFDPLDGSSNIDANVSIGSIFAIYKINDPAAITTPQEAAKEILQPGREMVCAGYAMYGSATNLVISMGEGVHGFTLDPSLGEFVLTDPNMRIPSRGKIYSVNEGNARMWDPATTEYIKSLKYPEDPDKKAYALRYIGSMVADIHRTLLVCCVDELPGPSRLGSVPRSSLLGLVELYGPLLGCDEACRRSRSETDYCSPSRSRCSRLGLVGSMALLHWFCCYVCCFCCSDCPLAAAIAACFCATVRWCVHLPRGR